MLHTPSTAIHDHDHQQVARVPASRLPRLGERAGGLLSAHYGSPKSAETSEHGRIAPVMCLQRAIGNRAVLRMIARTAAPTAHAPTSTETGMPPILQRRCACGGIVGPSGECAACRARRLAAQGGRVGPEEAIVPPIVHEVLRSPGQPLDPRTRGTFELLFGHDFGGVRIHTDERAAASTRAVQARAYAAGRNVVFGPGAYAPATADGRRLLAHELVHVIQQRASAGLQTMPDRIGPADDALEQEADRVANHTNGIGGPTVTGLASGLQLQRTLIDEPAAGCGICVNPTLTGTAVHKLVQGLMKSVYPSIDTERGAQFPSSNDQDNGRLDLVRIVESPSGPTEVEIGEIKPNNVEGIKDGTDDLIWYLDQVQRALPGPLFVVGYLELPPPPVTLLYHDNISPTCPTQAISIEFAKDGLYLYSCQPARSQVSSDCCLQPPPVPTPEPEKQKSQKEAEEQAREALPDWVWALLGAAGATAVIACFATGVCEAGAIIAAVGEGVAELLIPLLEAVGIAVARPVS